MESIAGGIDKTPLFDPFGLVGPVILVGKILLQSLWREKIDWDIPVPSHVQVQWETDNTTVV